MTKIIDNSLQIFLDELASKAATPGGGSVAALLGAQAAALVGMVCRLTLGKADYAEVEEEMHALLARAESLRQILTELIQADVDVFNKLMACYAMPKQTDAEKAARSAAIQTVLKEATLVPLACAKACREALELSKIAAEKGSLGVISDAGAAAMAAIAGLKSAAMNVYINTGSLKDQDFAQAQTAELEAVLTGAEAMSEQIYQLVRAKL